MTKKKESDQNLSDEELAASYIFPHNLSEQEKYQADQEFKFYREEHLLRKSTQDKFLAMLLRLRFNLEDYIQKKKRSGKI